MGEYFNSSAQEGEIATWGKVHSYGNLFLYDNDCFDILHWQKMHAPKYPILVCMARDVLPVTASTVAVESVFSMGGRIVTDH